MTERFAFSKYGSSTGTTTYEKSGRIVSMAEYVLTQFAVQTPFY